MLGLAATESVAELAAPGFSSFFRVGGRVTHPRVYRLADLKALPAHTVAVSFQGPGGVQSHNFTGELLSDVATAAAPRVDADQKNDILRWTARVHATDNYEVVVALRHHQQSARSAGRPERPAWRPLRQPHLPHQVLNGAL